MKFIPASNDACIGTRTFCFGKELNVSALIATNAVSFIEFVVSQS
jgi:hypothetical protein